MACHQGVESSVSVTRALANLAEDTAEPKLGFLNVHYRAAGATLMGSVAHGAYEYPGKSYAGRFQHREPYSRCGACHDVHTTAVKVVDCAACHKEVTDKPSLRRIRVTVIDYDGNGNANEGLAEEIEHLRVRLLATIQAYAKTVAGKPIAYDLDAYPYFFNDTNNNGVADKDEAKFPNKYNAWTPRLLKAAYNYQFVTKEPGAYAHNPTYTLQILHDSLPISARRRPSTLRAPSARSSRASGERDRTAADHARADYSAGAVEAVAGALFALASCCSTQSL